MSYINERTFGSNDPIIRRENAQLEQCVVVGGKSEVVGFVREICWIRQVECWSRLVHRGVEIDNRLRSFIYHNCSSLLLMADETDDDGLTVLCKALKIDATSTLKMELVLEVKDVPAIPTGKVNYGQAVYEIIDCGWFRKGAWDHPGDEGYEKRQAMRIEPVIVTAESVVWNSDEPVEKVRELAAKLKAEHAALAAKCEATNAPR